MVVEHEHMVSGVMYQLKYAVAYRTYALADFFIERKVNLAVMAHPLDAGMYRGPDFQGRVDFIVIDDATVQIVHNHTVARIFVGYDQSFHLSPLGILRDDIAEEFLDFGRCGHAL